MAQLETEEITCELIVKAALYIMEARLPVELINTVSAYIDGVRDSAPDHSRALVGQIKQNPKSAQLQLDLRERVPSILAGVIANIGTQYIKEQGLNALVTPIAMWSIHSYARRLQSRCTTTAAERLQDSPPSCISRSRRSLRKRKPFPMAVRRACT